jgi:rhodanese-related sulfurtransferase
MKHWLFILALTAGMGIGSAQQDKTITAEELEKYLEQPDKIFFLDVREPKEIAELGSVPGYVNIPLGQLEKRLSEIPKDKLIITL